VILFIEIAFVNPSKGRVSSEKKGVGPIISGPIT